MKDQCGRPVQRDPTFLAETQQVPPADVQRMFGRAAPEAGATSTTALADPNLPVSFYTEAVATNKCVKGSADPCSVDVQGVGEREADPCGVDVQGMGDMWTCEWMWV